jgi:Fe-S cluster biogenesis protein NfuA
MIKKQVQKILDDLRPAIQMDGGDVELVEVDEKTGIVKVKLQGHCAHCPMATVTLKQGIEASLKKALPQIKEVINVK